MLPEAAAAKWVMAARVMPEACAMSRGATPGGLSRKRARRTARNVVAARVTTSDEYTMSVWSTAITVAERSAADRVQTCTKGNSSNAHSRWIAPSLPQIPE